MKEMPWESALAQAAQAQAQRLVEAEEEILRLKVIVTNLKRELRGARMRQENWLLRQQAWRAERRELLARLSPANQEREQQRERQRWRFREDGP